MKDDITKNEDDLRIHVTTDHLNRFRHQAHGFSLMPRQNSKSALSGRHQSLIRGRGLNFEELRHYQEGDDVKNIDWRVTLRTGKPHIRAYSEEKERQTFVCVDQRASMFFSSHDKMKSVIAAELAALTMWRTLRDNDRIGAAIISDNNTEYFKASRSSSSIYRAIEALSAANQNLSADSIASGSENQLLECLENLNRMKVRSSVLIIISDFRGFNSDTFDALRFLQRSNDIILIQVSDPLERELHFHESMIVSDGKLQLQIDHQHVNNHKTATRHFKDEFNKRQTDLKRATGAQTIPLVSISTQDDAVLQLKKALNGDR